MPSACVMSRVCSVSSHKGYKQLVDVPSVDSRVIGTLFVCRTFA